MRPLHSIVLLLALSACSPARPGLVDGGVDGGEPTDAGTCSGMAPVCFSGALGAFCDTTPTSSECREGTWRCPAGTVFGDDCAPCAALRGCALPTGLLQATYLGTFTDQACRPELRSLELVERSGELCLRTTGGERAKSLAVSADCEVSWQRSWTASGQHTEEARVRARDGGLSGTWLKRVVGGTTCETSASLLLSREVDGGAQVDAGPPDAGTCAARTLADREGSIRVEHADGGLVRSPLDEEVNVLAAGHSGSLRSIDVRSTIGVLRITFAAPLAATELVRAGDQAQLRLEFSEDTTLYPSPSQVVALSHQGQLALFGAFRSSFSLALPVFPAGVMVGLEPPRCTSTQPRAGCVFSWSDLTFTGPDLPFVAVPPGTEAVSGAWTVAVERSSSAFDASGSCDAKDELSFVAARR